MQAVSIALIRFSRLDGGVGWFVAFCALTYALFSGFDGLYGQDPYGYAQDAWNLHQWLREGTDPPPFFWSRGYSGLGAILSLPWDSPAATARALQLVSIASLTLTAMIAKQWFRDRHPGQRGWFWMLAIFVGFAPFLFRAGVLVMTDMPAIACATLALWQCGRYLRKPTAYRHLAWAALACGLTVAFRYALAPILMLPMLGCLWIAVKNRHYIHLLLPLLAALPLGLLLFSFPEAMPAPVHSTVSAWSLGNFFTGDFVNADGQFHFPYPNIIYVLAVFVHPGYAGFLVPFTLLGAWRCGKEGLKPDLEAVLLLGALAVYLIFIGGLPFQNQRFLLPALPIVLLLYAPYWAHGSFLLGRILPIILWPLLMGVVTVYGMDSLKHFNSLNDLEQIISNRLVSEKVHTLYTFDMAPALQFRNQALKIHNFYDPHMPLPQPGQHVLSRFPYGLDQWAGKAPAINWARIQDSCRLRPLWNFPPSNFTLYAVD